MRRARSVARDPHVVAQPIPAAAVLDDQDVRQVGIAGDHRRGERFDEVEELGVRETGAGSRESPVS